MSQEIKQWGDLNIIEQRRRELLASEGLVCIDCGQPSNGLCSNCQRQHDFECETDIVEIRSYDENGEETIRVYEKDTGKLFSEFNTVSIHDVPTPKNLIRLLGWTREND